MVTHGVGAEFTSKFSYINNCVPKTISSPWQSDKVYIRELVSSWSLSPVAV